MSALLLDLVVIENMEIDREWKLTGQSIVPVSGPERVPAGVLQEVPIDIYNTYRLGHDSACVDIVLVTEDKGIAKVLLSKRKKDVCYGGTWWVYGGALHAYQSVEEFITDRASKECGVTVRPQVLIGVYRTCAADHIGSSLQVCYAAKVPFEALQKKIVDSDHTDVRLFSLEEFENLPDEECHWYPMRVARLALSNMP